MTKTPKEFNYYEGQLARLQNSEYDKTVKLSDGTGNATNYLSLNRDSIPALIHWLEGELERLGGPRVEPGLILEGLTEKEPLAFTVDLEMSDVGLSTELKTSQTEPTEFEQRMEDALDHECDVPKCVGYRNLAKGVQDV